MKSRFFLLLFFAAFLAETQAADMRHFRLSYRDDPATTITIGWTDDAGTLYFGTEDFGTNWNQYPSSQEVDRTAVVPTRGGGITARFVRLTGLQPKTVYYFVVRAADGTLSQRYSFKTMSDNSEDPISFVTGGDSRTGVPIFENCHSDGCRQKRQQGNRLVAKIRPDFIVFNGDYVFDGRDRAQWIDWLNDWELTVSPDGRLTPIIPSLGNHEDNQTVFNMFDVPTNDLYYALSFGAASNPLLRMYTLNNENLEACAVNPGSRAQLRWLENDLQNYSQDGNRAFWKFVQYHIPMAPQGYYDPRLDVRNCWVPLFTEYDVRVAMESHTHIFKISWPAVFSSTAPTLDRGMARDDEKGTVFIGEGMWGAPFRPVDKPTRANPRYSWTREAGTNFCSFFYVNVNQERTSIKTVVFERDNEVEQSLSDEQGADLPAGVTLYDASYGAEHAPEVIIPRRVVSSVANNLVKDFADVYPNPAGSEFNLSFKQVLNSPTIEIYDARGHLCEQLNYNQLEGVIRLGTEKMCTGVNIIMVKSDEGIQVLKLIKQ